MTEQTNWEHYLLNDDDVADFIIKGYLIVDTGVKQEVNRSILARLNSLDSNPGDKITEAAPQLSEIYDHPRVRGALSSLLGHDYSMNEHRHCHRNPSGSRSQIWHQDSLDISSLHTRHDKHVHQLLMMYYPQDVNKLNGPTALIPGTHLLSNQAQDRTASQGNFKYQVIAEVPAGHVLILHYDIWHAGTANSSGNIRYMIKFLFDRVSESTIPSWKHDPSKSFGITTKLDAQPTIGLQRSLGDRIRINRREMWNNLSGSRVAIEDYYDRFTGAWPTVPT